MSPELREEIGGTGRQTAVDHLDARKIAADFAELVTAVVPTVPGASAR